MSPTVFGWLVLLCPLVGTIVLALGFRWLPGRSAGWIGTLAIALAFAFSVAVWLPAATVEPRRDPIPTQGAVVGAAPSIE